MSDQEETLVLNYLDDDLSSEISNEKNGSFDENQNSKVSAKDDIAELYPKKVKKKKVVLQKKMRGVRKSSINNNKQNTLRNRNLRSAKINGIKSMIKLLEVSSTKEDPVNDDVVVKVENEDEEDNTKQINGISNDKTPPKVNTLKSEPINQIHSEFKYESHSETEENLKKKHTLNSETTNKNLSNGDNKNQLKQVFTVVDLKPNNFNSIKSIFKCNHCLYVANSKANLERHSLIHMNPEDILWYKCSICEYKSKYETQLKSHMLVHKKPDEITYFQCPHCDLKCSRKHNLTNHIKSIHSDRVNNLRCAECSYSTFTKDRLVAHLKMHSKEVFSCHLCKFMTKRKEYLDNHFKLKHTEVERPFLCDTCSYKGKTKRELVRHYNRMHKKDQLYTYECDRCDFKSIYKKNLEFHVLHMHENSEGFQKFICGHCEKEFAYKNGLKTHIVRIHLKLTDDDWHKCQECKYKCKDVNTLKRHIKRNHGAPRLHCTECNFATNREKSMTAHMKTHKASDEEILKCPDCPYRIIPVVSFLYHMKTSHGKSIGTKGLDKYYLK